jgi:hypothetical protein
MPNFCRVKTSCVKKISIKLELRLQKKNDSKKLVTLAALSKPSEQQQVVILLEISIPTPVLSYSSLLFFK